MQRSMTPYLFRLQVTCSECWLIGLVMAVFRRKAISAIVPSASYFERQGTEHLRADVPKMHIIRRFKQDVID